MRLEKADAVELAERLEDAREKLELTFDQVSAAVWPGDRKRRTRYNTVIRTLKSGGFPQWDSLGPIVLFLAEQGFPLHWLLTGRWSAAPVEHAETMTTRTVAIPKRLRK